MRSGPRSEETLVDAGMIHEFQLRSVTDPIPLLVLVDVPVDVPIDKGPPPDRHPDPDAARETLLQGLRQAGGSLDLSDGSSPDEIRECVGLRKKSFKKA